MKLLSNYDCTMGPCKLRQGLVNLHKASTSPQCFLNMKAYVRIVLVLHVKSLEVDILFNKGKAEQTEKSKTLLDLKGDEDKGQSIVPKIGETDRQI